MRSRPSFISIFLFSIVLISSTGCSTTQAVQPAGDASAAEPTSAEPDEISELEALYWARQDSARMSFTQADVDFMVGMIGHHAQALIMSDMAPTHGASPAVQTLAARIINAQKDEIASMQRWLDRRGQPVPEVHIDGLDLMIHGAGDHHHDHSEMPGMLSRAQLEELDAARGETFDRLFLTYMIQHHSGAVTMVEKLVETDGAAQDDAAFKLASDINVDQQTEIARMKKMLRALTGNASAD